MILRKDKKISTYRIILYILIVIIIITLIILRAKIIKNESAYNQEIYDDVYREFNEIMKRSSEDNDKEALLARFDAIKEKNGGDSVSENIDGKFVNIVGRLAIDKIELDLPIIAKTNYEYLKVAPTKLCGSNPNKVGNLCVVGHNDRNGMHFSRLKELKNNDTIKVTDLNGKTESYVVYDIYTCDPSDLNCLSQETNGAKEVTLITCTNDSKGRLILKCKHVN